MDIPGSMQYYLQVDMACLKGRPQMDELRPTVHPQLFLTSVQLKAVALVHYCLVYLHMY